MGSDHKHRAQHVLEIADDTTERVDLATRAVKAISGVHAFRKYDWLQALPMLNKSGNLRGMVISARYRTLFDFSVKAGKYLEGLGTLASIAADLAANADRFAKIQDSDDPPSLKALRFASAAGTMANHALLGVVPAGASTIYMSLQGYCMAAGLLGGRFAVAADACLQTLRLADTYVKTSYDYVTEDTNISRGAAWLINLDFMPR